MKNIHVLPTNKPSRLWINNLLQGKLELNEEALPFNTSQNIHITSDEKLPYDDSIFDTGAFYHKDASGTAHIITKNTFKPNPNFCKRIILTTDPELISDGVQAIDDEFLEWFVKNPSCEEVEIGEGVRYEDEWIDNEDGGEIFQHQYCSYKIIIPKEEPKQKTSKVTRVEVIQHSPPYNGRAYTNYNAKDVEIQFQDDGRTLKIFLK